MRLFIAAELPKNVLREVDRALAILDRSKNGGRLVPLHNAHVTLSFLGETNDLVGAVEAMRHAVLGIRPFSLHLGKICAFKNSVNTEKRTAYISVCGNLDELNSLHESLNSALSDHGFSTEHKKYVPHITLSRGIILDDSTAAALDGITPALSASMSVSAITLFESTRTERGMVYSKLHTEKFI